MRSKIRCDVESCKILKFQREQAVSRPATSRLLFCPSTWGFVVPDQQPAWWNAKARVKMIAKACERSRKLYCYPTDTNSNRSILALRTPVNLLDPGTPPVLDPAGFFRPRLLSEDESKSQKRQGPRDGRPPKMSSRICTRILCINEADL